MPEFHHRGVRVAYEVEGRGAPVLLLHGFPQTRAMWDAVAPRLAARFTVVRADLRGYGASGTPEDAGDTYSFRAMAGDAAALMAHLGHDRFHLVGHDRGARVAHRLALDHGARVVTLTLMDILPTRFLLDDWNLELAAAYWHWTFLAQPAPFPETLIAADPDRFYEACLLGWGGARLEDFAALAAYRAAWRDPDVIRGMTADYRATLTVDREHDAADAGRRVNVPALVLWGAGGVMARLYDVETAWRDYLSDMRGRAIPGGHFFVDAAPDATATALLDFLPFRVA